MGEMGSDLLERASTLTEALQSLVEVAPDEEALVLLDRKQVASR